MGHVGGWMMRVLAGLLAAGVVVPLTVKLPERLQGRMLVLAITVACIATALLVGRRQRSR